MIKISTLQKLRNEYLEGRPPVQSENLKILLKNSKNSNQIFEWTLGNLKYLPPIQYRIAYVKFVIKQLEDKASTTTTIPENNDDYDQNTEEDEDILEEWYNCLEKLSMEDEWSEPFYRLYNISDEDQTKTNEEMFVKILENEGAFVSDGTTGLVTWEASLHFVKWFTRPDSSRDSDLDSMNWAVELGCGCGFLGISILHWRFLAKYVATDGSASALNKCQENFKINFDGEISTPVDFETLDWTNQTDVDNFSTIVTECTRMYGTGFLIGADIVFDPQLIPHLLKLVQKFISVQSQISKPGKALLSCTIRNDVTVKYLLTQLETSNSAEGGCLSQKIVHSWGNGFILQIES